MLVLLPLFVKVNRYTKKRGLRQAQPSKKKVIPLAYKRIRERIKTIPIVTKP